MTIQYVNVAVGPRNPRSGEVPVSAVAGSAVQAGHVSVAYDTSVVTSLVQLKAALDAAYRLAQGNAALAKGA